MNTKEMMILNDWQYKLFVQNPLQGKRETHLATLAVKKAIK